ncbi:facilitated trehalose transporter Tret1 [Colletes latitarsis]|uniref:facilitated trehalose transporter Tret1 n=1 Tax=Colletes latitarsis TaxID=2605962 RepID=UPI00403757B0
MDESRLKRWPQYLAAFTATLSMASSGSHIGWTSPILPKLKAPDSHLEISSDDASWIASFALLGSIPGNVVSALIVDRVGRKMCLLLAGIPLGVSWVLIIIAWNPYILYVARFIGGLGLGMAYVACPMYIGEIADKEIRGSLGSFIKLMVTFGELYSHTIGPFATYQHLAYSCVIIPIIFIVTFIWMPESPYYLLIKNRENEARNNLRLLKRYATQDQLEEDMNEMQKTVIRDLSDKGHFWDVFGTPGNRKAVIIGFGLQVVLQFSGLAAIESYTQEIFEAADVDLSAGIAVIILSLLQLFAGLGAAALVDKLGRRPLLLFTTLLDGLTLTITAVFYFLKFQMFVDMSKAGWILHTSVIFYEIFVALGLNPLSYMMLGELFPTNIKGAAVCMANMWASFLAFIVSKMYQVISDTCGVYVSFGWFAISCFVGMAFIIFLVPETKGKSLLEIQEELNFKKKKLKGATEKDQPEVYVSTIA